MLGALIVPLLYSFEKQIRYDKKLKYLLPAISFTGAIFLIWDIRFESLGIWSFNPEYLTGIYIMNLPVEEWLFFIVIPYCCVFIYEIVKVKLSRFEKPDIALILSILLLIGFGMKEVYSGCPSKNWSLTHWLTSA